MARQLGEPLTMRSLLKVLLALAPALVVVLAPAMGWACPACAAREGSNTQTLLVIGSMMMLPFGIAGVVIFLIRKGDKSE